MKIPKEIKERLHIDEDLDVEPCPICHMRPKPYRADHNVYDDPSWYCHCPNEDNHEYGDGYEDLPIGAYGEYTKDSAITVWNSFVIEYEEENGLRDRK